MSVVVVVASAELDRDVLREHVSADDELHIVVPAVEQSPLQWLANDEDDARAQAEGVGNAIDEAAPTDASSIDVKPDLPEQLVRDAIAQHDPDRILVVLREGEDASWLEEGELAEIPGEIAGVPVTRLAV